MKKSVDRYNAAAFARIAVLCAAAAVLSILEGVLPDLPVPGAKLGLANLAVMTALFTDELKGGLCTALFKEFFALVTRGPAAALMSFSGSMLSTFVVWLAIKYDKGKLGVIGIGITGAVFHNLGQLITAYIIIGDTVRCYVPYLIIAAVFTGTVTGIVNSALLPYQWQINKNRR